MKARPTRREASSGSVALVALVALAGALGAACGDLYADPIVSSPQASQDALPPVLRPPPTLPPDPVPSCPGGNIVEGNPCSSVGATCEQGSSPDARCNITLECVPDRSFGQTWTARPSTLCPSYECPRGQSAPIDGTPCAVPTSDAGVPADSDELVCQMSDAICACTTGIDATHAHSRKWVCVKPAGYCPATRPLIGATCSQSGSLCDYGGCNFKRGMRMECNSNVWSSGSVTCN
jgi:hypothetical protein